MAENNIIENKNMLQEKALVFLMIEVGLNYLEINYDWYWNQIQSSQLVYRRIRI